MSSLIGPANCWICPDCLGVNRIPLNRIPFEGETSICSSCTKTSFARPSTSSVSVETPGHRLAKLTEKANESRLSPVVANWIEARCTNRAKEGKKEETIYFSELFIAFDIKEEEIAHAKGIKWLEGMGYEVTPFIKPDACDGDKAVGITLSWAHHIKENAESS